MMDNTQIEKALARLFDEEGHRIVFWNDPEKEFINTFPFILLPKGIKILRLDQAGERTPRSVWPVWASYANAQFPRESYALQPGPE